MIARWIALLLAPLGIAPAMAAGQFSLGITGGTLGVGPQIGYRGTNLGLRADATFLSLGRSFNSNDIRYDGHAKLQSAGAMLDLYPFGGGFRLSAGARYNGNTARAVATPTANTTVGGQSFTPAQIGTLTGRGTVKDFAPALTIGYGSGLGHGVLFGIEGGALFQGRVRISRFTASTGLIPQARLDAERADFQDDVDKYKVYPVVQLSLGYRF